MNGLINMENDKRNYFFDNFYWFLLKGYELIDFKLRGEFSSFGFLNSNDNIRFTRAAFTKDNFSKVNVIFNTK